MATPTLMEEELTALKIATTEQLEWDAQDLLSTSARSQLVTAMSQQQYALEDNMQVHMSGPPSCSPMPMKVTSGMLAVPSIVQLLIVDDTMVELQTVIQRSLEMV